MKRVPPKNAANDSLCELDLRRSSEGAPSAGATRGRRWAWGWALALSASVVACSTDDPTSSERWNTRSGQNGQNGNSGASTNGTSTGGTSTGGASTGETATSGTGVSTNGGAVNIGDSGLQATTGSSATGPDGSSQLGTTDAAADSGGGLADAGSGQDTFQPCPGGGEPCKILPLGDSITCGLGSGTGFSFSCSGGGYRVPLFQKALADGKTITFVGSTRGGPSSVDGAAFPASHEGHSGWTVSQIAGLVPTPALRDAPHIVLLMAGTNDMYNASSASGAPRRFEGLLDALIAELPEALVVVAQLTPINFAGSANIPPYNTALASIVDARAQAGRHVLVVDMYGDFPPGQLADGVHPNNAGYAFMADMWYDAIAPYLR